jgi:hypothetical protein
MTNYYHLIVETPESHLAKGKQPFIGAGIHRTHWLFQNAKDY